MMCVVLIVHWHLMQGWNIAGRCGQRRQMLSFQGVRGVPMDSATATRVWSDSEGDVKNPPASMKAGQDCQDFFKKSENGCGQESSGGEWKEVASIDGEPNVS